MRWDLQHRESGPKQAAPHAARAQRRLVILNTTIFLDLPAYSVQCRPALRNRAGGWIKERQFPNPT